ncbi:MAG TPA: hypothetical protein VFL62_20820 [Bradyrhizobium sp.]|uniref:hypothetical protein n=1 Tax=Bradyrhizobium sp. TaxID=376 RepID=UPI002D8074E4|nr:hypothetical protein [Bradyrhizobium sp.]HET7888675.1 hypothetical protein [Bradyrhizobium sp.]
MIQSRLKEFLQILTPPTRSNLLDELERLELCGEEIPGAGEVMESLRAEFRGNGQTQKRNSMPARYFFGPIEPLLVEGAAQHPTTGAIQRASLSAIWEWITRDLLPTMARDYVKNITDLLGMDKQREARQAAATFQGKVVKSMENILASPESGDQIRSRLSAYTASPTAFDDLTKMLSALRARDEIAKLNEALPAKFARFEDADVAKITPLLDAFAKTHREQVPFALMLVAKRLKTPWHLLRLATKTAASKNAADVAASPYAAAVSMVLDRLQDRRALLRIALKKERILVAKEILIDIYDTEFALRVRIDQLADSDWGKRLDALMASITELVESEIRRFPDNVGHVLGSRSLRRHDTLMGRVTYWAWKGRDVATSGVALCKDMLGGAEKSRA